MVMQTKSAMLSSELLDILACPICKGVFSPLDEETSLHCPPCGLRFPIRNGIPVMLADEAEKVAVRTVKIREL
jgi:uncharacterized protein YbaR (Trm112 family)